MYPVSLTYHSITAIMRPHQLTGLSFLVFLYRNGVSGILADEMGLGKTLQAISLLQHLKENPDLTTMASSPRICLVVCPLTVLNTWMKEVSKWAPELTALKFYGSSGERKQLKKAFKRRSDIDLVVTSYETFQTEEGWFLHHTWKYVILDEGHTIKDHTSKIAKSLQKVRAENRLMLTGTPFQNHLQELWSLLHWYVSLAPFCYTRVLKISRLYKDVFDRKTEAAFTRAFDLGQGIFDMEFLKHVSQFLELVTLKRTKDKIACDLPVKNEVLLYTPLAPIQRECYESLLGTIDQMNWERMLDDTDKSTAQQHERTMGIQGTGQAMVGDERKKYSQLALSNLLMSLRKCCDHPDLVTDSGSEGRLLVEASGKLIILQKLIEQVVFKEKKKVLIFSGFKRMLDICEQFLATYGSQTDDFRVLRLDGSTCLARRNLAQRLLNDEKSPHRVMLVSMRAGGLGITLTGASEVVMLDQWAHH